MDNRELIEVELTDEEFLNIAKLAHERDITFNQMVAYILEQEIARSKSTESEEKR